MLSRFCRTRRPESLQYGDARGRGPNQLLPVPALRSRRTIRSMYRRLAGVEYKQVGNELSRGAGRERPGESQANKAILDQSWGELRHQLEYKTE